METLLKIVVFLFLINVKTTIPVFAVDENRSFASYQQAVRFYANNFKTFDILAPESTSIYAVIYFYTTERKVFFIAFKSRPKYYYIYEGLSSNVWSEFKKASSKGSFYQKYIRGRYNFTL